MSIHATEFRTFYYDGLGEFLDLKVVHEHPIR